MKIINLAILTLFIWWSSSCSPPHDNPLDPASDNYVEPPPPPGTTPIPTFSTILRSVHTGRISTDIYKVLPELWPDSALTIDSVLIQYDGLSTRRMSLSTVTGHWSVSLTSSFFGDDDLESIIGQPFYFFVHTPNDSIWSVGPKYVFRIIQETPATGNPDSNLVVGSFPTLNWPAFGGSYPFYYQTVVERKNDILQIITVWTSDTLASTATQVQVADSLEDDTDYHWILLVFDEYGNTSLSLETPFQVQSGLVP